MFDGCEVRSSCLEEVDFATTHEWVGDSKTLSSLVLGWTDSTIISTEVGDEMLVSSVDDIGDNVFVLCMYGLTLGTAWCDGVCVGRPWFWLGRPLDGVDCLELIVIVGTYPSGMRK